MGQEWCHAQFFGQGDGLSVEGLGRLDGRRIVLRMNLTEEAQVPGLMAAFLVGTGEIEGLYREVHRLIPAPGQQIGFA